MSEMSVQGGCADLPAQPIGDIKVPLDASRGLITAAKLIPKRSQALRGVGRARSGASVCLSFLLFLKRRFVFRVDSTDVTATRGFRSPKLR